ncbi:Peptidase family M23 [Saccharopolyspora shandongensis]|uniref:Peptidase family M23 n=1 Tax=Saccharopolyspora shandongensis TaxID=418495 RepID=A0A1H3E1I9_9PSEU|nr:M23 family metallopeptidase [Saccharopolyspora shandongensis]SDX72138.1 Peptidase family M23 [Saccharopolyspora shandongensis]
MFLGVFGGALAAASASTAHEAQAAGHSDTGVDDVITPIASISHAISDSEQQGSDPSSARLLPAQEPADRNELADLNKSVRVSEDRAAAEADAAREREAKEREAQRNRVVWPVEGRVTSKPGARWGTTHYGLDIANRIGTPIRAVKRGTVIEAGPASGFGLWVRLQHDDGTITVYGHINRALVRAGERVEAGEVIAEVGNRGQSTGPHLHFEVWDADSRKVNPLTWLQRNGARP